MTGLGGAALFGVADPNDGLSGIAVAPMGTRVDSIGRYKMPPLPDGSDSVPKRIPPGLDPWVSGGLQSMTNLAGSISETRALGIWELEQACVGLGMHAELYDDLRALVHQATADGVNFQRLKEHKAIRTELAAIVERAKDISGANAARDAGIFRHDVWERPDAFAEAEQVLREIKALNELLDAAGFDVIPEYRERTVRNLAVKAAGRFDNIIMHRKSGRLLIADLKTKRGNPDGGDPFWGWQEMDAQLAGYAYSELMLEMVETSPGVFELAYVPGPKELGVDLTEGVVLHMPSDGGEPRLRRADLVDGWRALQLARQVCDVRSRGKSAARKAESWWPA